MVRVWRNSKGAYDWFHFEQVVREAANSANDLGLTSAKNILERTLTRGEFILRRYNCPHVTLSVFTDKLPNTRGLSKDQIERDLKDARAIQKAQSPGSKAGTAPFTGGARGRGAYGASAPSSYPASRGGYAAPPRGSWQRAPPAGFAPLPPAGRHTGAVATQPVMLPFPPGTGGTMKGKSGKGSRKGGGRGGGGSGGGGGSAPPQPRSNRALAAIVRFNGIMQEDQQQLQPTPGGQTCDKCTAAGRNPNHDHRICAFLTCFRCKRVGHRSNACQY